MIPSYRYRRERGRRVSAGEREDPVRVHDGGGEHERRRIAERVHDATASAEVVDDVGRPVCSVGGAGLETIGGVEESGSKQGTSMTSATN